MPSLEIILQAKFLSVWKYFLSSCGNTCSHCELQSAANLLILPGAACLNCVVTRVVYLTMTRLLLRWFRLSKLHRFCLLSSCTVPTHVHCQLINCWGRECCNEDGHLNFSPNSKMFWRIGTGQVTKMPKKRSMILCVVQSTLLANCQLPIFPSRLVSQLLRKGVLLPGCSPIHPTNPILPVMSRLW